jgi:hypothetical protein
MVGDRLEIIQEESEEAIERRLAAQRAVPKPSPYDPRLHHAQAQDQRFIDILPVIGHWGRGDGSLD